MELPQIDLALLRNQDGEQTIAFDEACKDLGFFKVVNHGIEEDLMQKVLSMMESFFQLHQDEKRTCNRSLEHVFGFNDAELTKQKKDSKEIFDIGPPGESQKWPGIEEFEEVMRCYYGMCEIVLDSLSWILSSDVRPFY